MNQPLHLEEACVVVFWHGIMPPDQDTWILKATALDAVTRYLHAADAGALRSLILAGNKVRIDIGPPIGPDKPVPVKMASIDAIGLR